MTDRQYEETIINILCEVLEVNKDLFNNIKKNDPLGSLGLNSLKAIQVIVKLEDTYGVSFEDEDLFFDKINTLEKIINTLGKYVKE